MVESVLREDTGANERGLTLWEGTCWINEFQTEFCFLHEREHKSSQAFIKHPPVLSRLL